jgi:hypothetical protein
MMNKRPGIELSTVQVVSSMGAAVTGAVLTSYLGDGGTVVGTAVGAGVSTAGFAVYKHYLARTKEKVAPVIVEHARQWSPVSGTQSSRGTSSSRGASPGAPAAPGDQAAPGTATSPNRPANGATVDGVTWGRYAGGTSADQTQPRYAWDPGDARTRDFGHVDTETARPSGTVRMGGAGHEGDGGPGEPGKPGRPGGLSHDGPGSDRDGNDRNGNDRNGSGPGKHGKANGGGLRDRPRWVVLAATSAAVFLVTMLVITLIEFGTGKPIDATVWGRNSSGTTLGNVTGSKSNSKSGTVTPTVSPTPTQSATPGGVGQTEPQPTSRASTAPSPSSVPSVSTVPSQSAPVQSAPVQSAPAQNGSGHTTPTP